MIWLLTCEHYSNAVPFRFAERFLNAIPVLESHRGYDLKAAPLFIRLEPLFDQSFHYRYSRLLIDPNLPLTDNFLFSPITAHFSRKEKADLIHDYYHPYRSKVESFVRDYIEQGVLHISLHTYQPEIGTSTQQTPIGLRFHMESTAEEKVAKQLEREIKRAAPSSKVALQLPYKNTKTRFQSYLRSCFSENYIGIEIEVRNDVAMELRQPLFEALSNLRGVFD